jgi:hypothetical protein
MAKDKSKSRVSSKFNIPPADLRKKIAADVTGADQDEPKEKKTDGRGRPKAQHGFPAFTTQIDPKKRAALKYIASVENRKLFELIDEAWTTF